MIGDLIGEIVAPVFRVVFQLLLDFIINPILLGIGRLCARVFLPEKYRENKIAIWSASFVFWAVAIGGVLWLL